MALKAGYKGIKKFIADKLNALGDVDSLATDAEVAAEISDALDEVVGWNQDDIHDSVEVILSGKVDNSVIAPVEDEETSSQAYAIGEHFIRGEKFCTTIQAIAAEATLTKNTNYIEGSITDFLQIDDQKATSEVTNCTIDDLRNHCVKDGGIVTLRIRFTLAADQTAAAIIKVPFLSYLNPSYLLLFDQGTRVLQPVAYVNVSGDNSYINVPALVAGTYEISGTYVTRI